MKPSDPGRRRTHSSGERNLPVGQRIAAALNSLPDKIGPAGPWILGGLECILLRRGPGRLDSLRNAGREDSVGDGQTAKSVYEFSAPLLDGRPVGLDGFRGHVLLIVNAASRCGFTPQYAGLEELYRRYKDRGFAVLGFPCNQFGAQEPGTENEIGAFCEANYGVSFPMFAKIEVNGPGTHPLYAHLKKSRPGLLGSERIKWNFTKFLVDRKGAVVRRYGSSTKPAEIVSEIERLLNETP